MAVFGDIVLVILRQMRMLARAIGNTWLKGSLIPLLLF